MHVQQTIPQIRDFQRINCALDTAMAQVILGPAGSGKSHFCRFEMPQIIAEARGISIDQVGVVFTQPAIRDSVEYSGVGLPQKTPEGQLVTRFSVPALIEQIQQQRDLGALVVLVIYDELSAAADDIQKVIAPSLDDNDRRLGDMPVGDDVIFIATGNRSKDKAGSRRLLSHLINRVAICEMDRDDPAWITWARNNGINELMVSCAETYPDFFEYEAPTEDGPFNTYRQATNAAKILDGFIASADNWDGMISNTVRDWMAQMIGDRAAAMLQSFSENIVNDVPTPEEIFRDPLAAYVPDDTCYQMIAVNRATANLGRFDSQAANKLFEYIERCRADIKITLAKNLCDIAAKKGLDLNSEAARDFMVKHRSLLKYTR